MFVTRSGRDNDASDLSVPIWIAKNAPFHRGAEDHETPWFLRGNAVFGRSGVALCQQAARSLVVLLHHVEKSHRQELISHGASWAIADREVAKFVQPASSTLGPIN